eukprot:13642092-Alexandrium_andersonii.AAC.1
MSRMSQRATHTNTYAQRNTHPDVCCVVRRCRCALLADSSDSCGCVVVCLRACVYAAVYACLCACGV